MKLVFYCPIWGMEHQPLDDVLSKIKRSGYDGAEIALNPEKDDLVGIKKLFNKHELRMIAQHPFSAGSNYSDYFDDFAEKVKKITSILPDKINCHTGKYYYSFDDNLRLLKKAEEIACKAKIAVAHEIHRGRFSYSPATILPYLYSFPELKLVADFSHWCVVSESLLADQTDTIDQTIKHCIHVHARVGDSQSAQVNHPGSPDNEEALKVHSAWWKKIFDQHKRENKEELTITCEFGPSPYLSTLPYTGQPVADQWELNMFMKDYLTKKVKLWNKEKKVN
jgi:sugar phosphate isomerase/epimerase